MIFSYLVFPRWIRLGLFGSEIRFKIGGDTSALSAAFTKAQSVAAVAGKQIERKLGMKDAFKGLMQGIGIGSVDGIAQMVVRPFELAADRARNLLGLTSKLREIQTNEIGQTSGRNVRMTRMAKEANDLNVDIEQTEKLINDLNDDPLTFVNQDAFAMLKEAEQELVTLKTRQAELQSAFTIETKNSARAVEEWAKEEANVVALTQAELRHASEREKIEIRLKFLRQQGEAIARREGKDSKEALANQRERFQLGQKLWLLDKQAREDRPAELVSLGQSAARGVVDRRARGRSETERIAARGAGFAAEAEEAILTGKSPAFIARLTRLANQDLGTAGQRIAQATAAVDKDATQQAIKSELITANKTLQQIEKNLEPAEVPDGQ